ncbi:MAG: sigma-70 family RNA polymerase sigma factor [Thermoanaerobaculia bacterium]
MSREEQEATDVTELLHAWRGGDPQAGETLFARIFQELKRIAAAQLRGERAGHTLQPTAIVNEAYLRLLRQQHVDWRDRAHFFGLASTMMRRVLVDHARARHRLKRQHDDAPMGLLVTTGDDNTAELIDLDRALERFSARFPRQTKMVEMRYFAGLEIAEIAACLDLSPATVKRDWQFARAWLIAELDGDRSKSLSEGTSEDPA